MTNLFAGEGASKSSIVSPSPYGSGMNDHLGFWSAALKDLPEQAELRLSRPTPNSSGSDTEVIYFSLDDLHSSLAAFAKDSDCGLFTLIAAGLATLMTRLGAGTDILMGTPVAAPIRISPLRIDTAGNPTFRDVVGRVRAVELDARNHQDVTFQQILEILKRTNLPCLLYTSDAADE